MRIGLGIGLNNTLFKEGGGGGNVAPSNVTAPVISGSTSLGSVLTTTNGTWSGTPATFSYTYQWKRNGSPISGATASTYTTVVADSTANITCDVTADNGVAPTATAGSNTLTMANYTPANTVPPVVSGTAVVGQTLSTTNGTWTNSPSTFSYQWRRNGVDIGGATASTYTLVSADAGANIICRVTASNGLSASADSNTLAILATLLDLYPNAAAAYSVRLLRGAHYTLSAIRVRRSNDNAEQDIGFTTAGELNTSALTTFVGSNSGFIVTWYDQSGNANNATQTTPANQPRIVNAGVLDIVNSKAAPLFDGTNDFLNLTTTINFGASHLGAFVGKRDASARRIFGLATINTNGYILTHWTDNKFILQGDTAGLQTSNATDATTAQELLTGERFSGNMVVYKNNTLQVSTFTATALGTTINAIGRYASFYSFGYCQETIFYNTAQNSNRSGINTNIINYYGIV